MPSTFGSVTVTSSPTLIIGANNDRKGSLIVNTGGSYLYIGPTSGITIANAMPVNPNGVHANSGFQDSWRGEIYGVVEAGTLDIRFWEWDE